MMKRLVPLMLVLVPVVACGVPQQKGAAKAAVDVSSESQRKTTFEATAQLLDEKPEMVDELYTVMRLHPKAMDRFIANASTDLDQKWLASQTASYLVKNPAGLEETVNAVFRSTVKDPKARAAMNRSIATSSDLAVDIMTDDPGTMTRVVKSLLAVTEKKPAAKKALITAVHENRAQAIDFVKQDPAFARAVAVEVVKEMVKDKPTLEKVLASVGALDQPEGAPTPAPLRAKGTGPVKPQGQPPQEGKPGDPPSPGPGGVKIEAQPTK